ncbi:hypothetical protein TNCV_4645431 [Trichonephila clavipes]|nr:hypothetical protein TNCV_4645431 [Trichonephila clavipes]
MLVCPPLWCDWLTILAIVESSKAVCHASSEPPKSATTLDISVIMGDFINSVNLDMHLLYGAVNGNGRAVLHGLSGMLRFSDYIDSFVKMFHFSPILKAGVDRMTVRQTHLDEVILNHVEKKNVTSTRHAVYLSDNH